VLLFIAIFYQARGQLAKMASWQWWSEDAWLFISLSLLLMPLNLSLEALKWKLLCCLNNTITWKESLRSIFGGIAISILTPNRIGEYPARIYVLKGKITGRLLISAAMGAIAQFITLFLFGAIGLTYYNLFFPGKIQFILLISCIAVLLFVCALYFGQKAWICKIGNGRFLRRLKTYLYILQKFSISDQLSVLVLSFLRYLVFTTQFVLLLKAMNIPIHLGEGYFISFIFFWAIAVIPSFAVAELGIRGQVGILLFSAVSSNVLGILSATISLWFINLMFPAIIGSFSFLRGKLNFQKQKF
jgi:hypothetical protein